MSTRMILHNMTIIVKFSRIIRENFLGVVRISSEILLLILNEESNLNHNALVEQLTSEYVQLVTLLSR